MLLKNPCNLKIFDVYKYTFIAKREKDFTFHMLFHMLLLLPIILSTSKA